MKKSLIDTIKFEFGEADIFSDHLIMVMNEGIHVIPEFNEELIKLANTYFADREFVYITHRKHSYSVDPRIYTETSKISNLAGFAVVSDKEIPMSTTQVEKIFLNKPMQVFDTVEQAKKWVETVIRK